MISKLITPWCDSALLSQWQARDPPRAAPPRKRSCRWQHISSNMNLKTKTKTTSNTWTYICKVITAAAQPGRFKSKFYELALLTIAFFFQYVFRFDRDIERRCHLDRPKPTKTTSVLFASVFWVPYEKTPTHTLPVEGIYAEFALIYAFLNVVYA